MTPCNNQPYNHSWKMRIGGSFMALFTPYGLGMGSLWAQPSPLMISRAEWTCSIGPSLIAPQQTSPRSSSTHTPCVPCLGTRHWYHPCHHPCILHLHRPLPRASPVCDPPRHQGLPPSKDSASPARGRHKGAAQPPPARSARDRVGFLNYGTGHPHQHPQMLRALLPPSKLPPRFPASSRQPLPNTPMHLHRV